MLSGYSHLVRLILSGTCTEDTKERTYLWNLGGKDMLIPDTEVQASAAAASRALGAQIGNRQQAWEILKTAFNAVVPGLLPDVMPEPPAPVPAQAPAPAAQAARGARRPGPAAAGP